MTGEPTIPPLLIGANAAAALCGVSAATWWRLHSAGKVPAPMKLGGRTLWRRTELETWTAAGCLDRRAWTAIQAGQDQPSMRQPARYRTV